MQRLLVVSVVLLCSYSYSNAQNATTCVSSTDGTTNPLNNTQCLDSNNTVLDIIDQGDFGTGRHSSGQSQNQQYNNYTSSTLTSTDYILHFSYTDDTWVTNMAIDQALVGAGFDIGGYVAQWEWKNENTNTIHGACQATKVNGDCLDDLVITIDAYASGINIYSEEWDYSQTKSNGYMVEDILSFAPTALVPGVTIDEIEVTIRGKDNGYWQGMYGPKVKNLTGSLVLMPNQCSVNPLSDPTCPGYANALFQQQCTTNPLFDPSCSGYAAAYLAQQCAANPLYDTSCAGYSTAYYNQQCSIDPLYDKGCTGYQQAYMNQQCSLDPLYDSSCTGYQQAYLNQQCSIDPLYDASCGGYQTAYLAQQCDIDPLYDVTCTGYQEAYVKKQCESDPLYDVTCYGYQEAIELAKINEDLYDDGKPKEEDITNFTETKYDVEGIPDVIVTTPEPVYIEPEQDIVEDDYDIVQGDLLQMEDDIEKEIAELEREEAEMGDQLVMEDDIEKELEELENDTGNTSMEDDIEKEIADLENDANSGDGDTAQEDDIEKEIAELEEETEEDREDFQDPTQKTIAPKPIEKKVAQKKEPVPKSTRNEKIKMLLAQKAIELTKKIEQETDLEQQILIQRQLLALISYVPGFDYNKKKTVDNDFYPDKPVVDHAFARWFLNDPTFVDMEDMQYPSLRRN